MGHFAVVLSLFAATVISTSAGTDFEKSLSKRSITDDDTDTETLQMGPDELVDTALSDAEYASYLRSLPDWSAYKRAPMGFVGMRGKKHFGYSDYTQRALDGTGPRVRGQRPNYKRIYQQIAPRPDNKRVPTGFIGVYGKKDLSQLDQYADLGDLQQILSTADDTDNGLHVSDWQDLMEASKRVPSPGFFGMRGKKLYEIDLNPESDFLDKRAPTGFVGMRGKRFYNQLYNSYDEEKREPKGFFGMRGKKDDDDALIADKRSFAQFFGTRGKKQPFNSGFFGMRGKKQPFEFRSKFVGVRGKKIPEGSLQHSDLGNEVTEPLSINQLDDKTKRVPSGFVGMRGKKDSDNSSAEN